MRLVTPGAGAKASTTCKQDVPARTAHTNKDGTRCVRDMLILIQAIFGLVYSGLGFQLPSLMITSTPEALNLKSF